MMSSSLLALSMVAGFSAPAVDDPAALLPADTLIYFGSTSLRDSWEAGQNTAMSRILGEAEVKSFLHEPLAAANQVLKAGLEQMAGEIEEARNAAEGLGVGGDIDLESFNLSLDSSEPPVGRMFFALTKLDMMGQAGPEVGIALGFELLDEALAAHVEKLWGAIPAEESQAHHGGVDYLTRAIPESPFALHLAFLGELAVITTDVGALHGMIDRDAGRNTAGSLAASADYRAMLDAAGGLLPGGSSNMIRVAPLAQFCRMAMVMATQMSEDVGPDQAAMLMSVFDGLGLDALKVIGGTSAVGSDGLIYSTSVASVDTEAGGLVGKLAASTSGGSVDMGLLNTIPRECTSASVSLLGTSLVDTYDFIMDVARGAAPDEVGQFEQMAGAFLGGANLRDDVLANPHGTLVSYTTPGQGLMGQPDTVMSVGMRDGQAFAGVLGTLLESVAAQSGMPVSLKQSEHEGVPFYEIDLSATPVAMMMSPGFALRDGQLVFSTNTKTLKSVLNGNAVSGESLSGNERFASFVDGLKGKGDVTMVSYTDVAESFGGQYGGMVSMVSMVPMGDLPMDFSKLPPQSVIGQHLDESYSGAYATESGMTVSRSVSHFAMADFLPLVMVAGALYAGQQMGISPDEIVVEADPAELAMNDLRELKASITVYKISVGGYPSSLGDLLTPLDDFPQGAYPHGELPLDPWGNGYRFTMAEHPKKKRIMPKLWSLGPNGMDEGGAGDDIVKD